MTPLRVLQKQPFAGVLQNRCSSKSFCNIHRKAPVLEKTLTQMFSCEYCETFKKIYFEEDLSMASSGRMTVVANNLITD